MSARSRLRAALLGAALALLASTAAAEAPTREKDSGHLRARYELSAGPTYRSFYDDHVVGADLALKVGADFTHVALYGTAGGMIARTGLGLSTCAPQAGVGAELVTDYFRLGAGVQLSILFVTRDSGASGTLWSPGAGAEVHATLDVLHFDGHALFFGARGTIDSYGASGRHGRTLVLRGGSAFVGVRF